MNASLQNITAYNAVSTKNLMEYLKGKGWQELETLGDKAVILELAREDHKYSILLPLISSLSDYNYRMYEAFKTLEVTENRSQAELVNDFLDPTFIAENVQREIMNLKLASSKFNYEASAKHVGIILESMQGVLDAIGNSIQQKNLTNNKVGKISQDIIDKTRISILGTYRGSFGIRLALPHQGKLDLTDLSLGCQVIEEFMSIISSSQAKNYSDLSGKLIALQKHSVQKFRKFLFALSDSDINISLDWGSPFPSKGGSAILTFNNTLEIISFINDLDFSDIETYQLTAELIGVNKRNRKFELLTFEGEKITGTIESNLFHEKNVDLTIGKIYRFVIEETTMLDISQNEKIERKLINIEPH
jgi:hypothetical protein